MNWLDAIFQRAPGIVAKGLAGKREGEDIARKRQMQDAEQQREVERHALEQMLLQENVNTAPYRQRLLKAQTEDEEAQAAGTGRYAPKPVEPKARQTFTRTLSRKGKPTDVQFYEDTGEEIRELGESYQRPFAPPRTSSGGGGGRIAPASTANELSDWQSMLDVTKDAATYLAGPAGGKNVSGFFTGRSAGLRKQFGMAGEEETRFQSKLSNIATALGKLRSGGAITPQEFERLSGLIPNQKEDEGTIVQKLSELDGYISRVLQRRVEFLTDSGYDTRALQARMSGQQMGVTASPPGTRRRSLGEIAGGGR